MRVELGGGDGSCDVGDISWGLDLGGSVGASFGFGSPAPAPAPATTPADNVPLAATMPPGTTATYDAASGKVTLHVPPDLVLVRALGDVPLDWRAKLNLPMPNLGAIQRAVTPPAPMGHLGVVLAKVQAGQTSARSLASAPLVVAPAPTGATHAMALGSAPDTSSPAKKIGLVAAGVGALGTVTFLAWQAMR